MILMYYGGYGYNYFDPTYLLVMIGIAITMIASAKLKSTFAKYSKVRSDSGMTGAQVATKILQNKGIYNVSVQAVAGSLTDHYDPAKKTVNLSQDIYSSTSVAAIGVAAHECGHAIQDNLGYMPLRLRSAFVPVASIGSKLSWPLIIIGLIIGTMGNTLIQIGIILFSFAVIFQIITLPVEYDASHRALVELKSQGILQIEEEKGARKVLNAAALTYVAGAAASILQLLRLMILFGGRRRSD